MTKLSSLFKQNSGRNNRGIITFRHRGGGNKRRYRFIDFKRFFLELQAIVYKIEYDPNRTSFICLILYRNGVFSYILAYKGVELGHVINNFLSVNKNNMIYGNSFFLKDIPVGSLIYNVELTNGKGGVIGRSAGCYCQVVNKFVYDYNTILVRFKSKEEYLLNYMCRAVIGSVSNEDHKLKKYYKAGQIRWLSRRPIVRGVAMNPIDHPHGGGEGKTSGGRPSVTPYGVITKGKPTRKNKINPFILISRKK